MKSSQPQELDVHNFHKTVLSANGKIIKSPLHPLKRKSREKKTSRDLKETSCLEHQEKSWNLNSPCEQNSNEANIDNKSYLSSQNQAINVSPPCQAPLQKRQKHRSSDYYEDPSSILRSKEIPDEIHGVSYSERIVIDKTKHNISPNFYNAELQEIAQQLASSTEQPSFPISSSPYKQSPAKFFEQNQNNSYDEHVKLYSKFRNSNNHSAKDFYDSSYSIASKNSSGYLENISHELISPPGVDRYAPWDTSLSPQTSRSVSNTTTTNTDRVVRLKNDIEQKVFTIPTFAELCQYNENSKANIPVLSQLNNHNSHLTPPPGFSRASKSRVQDNHARWSPNSSQDSPSKGLNSSWDSPSSRTSFSPKRSYSSPSKNRQPFNSKPRSRNSGSESREVKVSKMLSGICRHQNGAEGLLMLHGGYFSVEEILNTPRFKQLNVTKAEIRGIVENNDKKRFTLKDFDGNLMVCANQGHSIEVHGLELEEVHSPEGLSGIVHGTFEKAWESIRTQGLHKMGRNHIHFAMGLRSDSKVISGMRSDCQIVIYIDVEKAMKDGYKFFKSRNNVILCPGNEQGYLPTEYFRSVINLRGQRELIRETYPVIQPTAPDWLNY